MYKILNGQAPEEFKHIFQPVSSMHRYQTRSSHNDNLFAPASAKLEDCTRCQFHMLVLKFGMISLPKSGRQNQLLFSKSNSKNI